MPVAKIKAKTGSKSWFFPTLDAPPKNLSRDTLVCPKCGPLAGVRLEEGPFTLPTAQLAWSVELTGKKIRATTLLLDQPPRARPPGKRRIRATCVKCGTNVLDSVQRALSARGVGSEVSSTPGVAAKGFKKPPFKVDLEEYAGAACGSCGNTDRIVFRPASRYGVHEAVLRADLAVDPRGVLALPASPEIGAAKRMELTGSLTEVAASCGHCGKSFPKHVTGAKKRPTDGKLAAPPSHADDVAHEAQAQLTSGRFEDALENAQLALEENKRHPRGLLVLAVASFKLKNHALAIPTMLELKKIDRKFAEANDVDAWLGACYEAQGQLSEAASAFRAKLKARPRDPSATLALARVLLLRDGPTGAGLKLLKEVARIPLAKDRALVDPRLAALRTHPAVRAVLGLA